MARGRPRKRARNISGLRNQAPRSSIPYLPNVESLTTDVEPPELATSDSSALDKPEQLASDTDANANAPIGGEDPSKESNAKVGEAPLYGDWENEPGMQESHGMVKLAVYEGDDSKDEDWLPYQLKNAKRLKTERPKEYAKGPDVMSKSTRTQRRYRKANRNQRTLDAFVFSARGAAQGGAGLPESSAGHASEPVIVHQERVETEIPPASVETQNPIEIYDETIGVGIPPVEAVIPQLTGRKDNSRLEDDQLDEGVQGGGVEIRGWDVLREQIKKEMKTRRHTLPLSQVNQLIILRNFATLRLKGYGEMDACLAIARQWEEGEDKHYAAKVQTLARHYQVFEQLPIGSEDVA